MTDKDLAAERARWRRRTKGQAWLIEAFPRFLSNYCSPRLLRSAHGRAGPWRLLFGILLTLAWLTLAGSAAVSRLQMDLGQINAAHAPAAAAAPQDKAGPFYADKQPPHIRVIASASDFICMLKSGKACDTGHDDWRALVAQIPVTFLAIFTVLFGFWTQVIGSLAHALRAIGNSHVVVTGAGSEAERLARDVARKGRRRRKAVVLVRSNASSAEVDALAADGVALIAGAPTDRAVLTAAGARFADRVVAISDSDSENLGVAAAAAHLRGARMAPGDVLVRLEDEALRRDLPSRGKLRAADMFSLPEIAARLLLSTPDLLDEAERMGHDRVHIAIVGWSPSAAAVATRIFRLAWAPGFAPPRVTVFAPNPIACDADYRALYPAAFAREIWMADIVFKPLLRPEADPWGALKDATKQRGPYTAYVVSWPKDRDTLHCAALLAKHASSADAPIIVHESQEETIAATLESHDGARVQAFAQPTKLLSASALVDRTLDRAAQLLHIGYIQTCVIGQHEEAYKAALRSGYGLWPRVQRMLRRAEGETIAELERDYADKIGARALNQLRDGLTQSLLVSGQFGANPNRPAQKPWNELREVYISSNRTAADHALYKLWRLGWRVARKGERGQLPNVTPADVPDGFAELEHYRWSAETLLSGYRRGERDEIELKHPDLRSYGDFPGAERDLAILKDRDPWLQAPVVAASQHDALFVRRK
jgi:Trk K+ transport system NAD-binding subunit